MSILLAGSVSSMLCVVCVVQIWTLVDCGQVFLECHFCLVAINNIAVYVLCSKPLLKIFYFGLAGAVPIMASGGIPMQPMHPPPPAGPRPPPLPPGRPPSEGSGNMKSVEDALKLLPPSLGSFLTRLPRAVSGEDLNLLLAFESCRWLFGLSLHLFFLVPIYFI